MWVQAIAQIPLEIFHDTNHLYPDNFSVIGIRTRLDCAMVLCTFWNISENDFSVPLWKVSGIATIFPWSLHDSRTVCSSVLYIGDYPPYITEEDYSYLSKEERSFFRKDQMNNLFFYPAHEAMKLLLSV